MNEQINQNQKPKIEQNEKISSGEILNSQEINDFLQKISLEPHKAALIRTANLLKSGEISEIEIRLEHQDDYGLYYAGEFFSKELSEVEPILKDSIDGFKKQQLRGLDYYKREDKSSTGLPTDLLDFILQLKTLYFEHQEDFKKEILTENNKNVIDTSFGITVRNHVAEIEKIKSYPDMKFKQLNELIGALFVYKKLIGDVEQFKDIIAQYGKEADGMLRKDLKGKIGKSHGSEFIYRRLLMLKFIDKNIFDFSNSEVNELKEIINENVDKSNQVNDVNESDMIYRREYASKALTYLGIINDIQREANIKK